MYWKYQHYCLLLQCNAIWVVLRSYLKHYKNEILIAKHLQGQAYLFVISGSRQKPSVFKVILNSSSDRVTGVFFVAIPLAKVHDYYFLGSKLVFFSIYDYRCASLIITRVFISFLALASYHFPFITDPWKPVVSVRWTDHRPSKLLIIMTFWCQ